VARQVYAAHSAAESRLEYHPIASEKISSVFGYDANDLVTEDEWGGCDR
jgi:hypothetical protein